MKHLTRAIIAVFMAVLMGTLLPVQVFADTPDYISEVKVFMGDYSAAESEGYTLLGNGSNPVDLNQNAGGGLGSKGEKAVYLGYKTTQVRSEAISDLALMNMKGGYDVAEYTALMNQQMKSQILPFIEKFQATIDEYRANYASNNRSNKQRASYIHDMLDKMIDDDTGSGLGTLLLNPTKQELGDAAYNALPDAEKKQHADLATIIAQSNGQATLMLENLLTRAADNNSDSWIDRFAEINYDKLVDFTGMAPTDANKELAKLYDDDAYLLLQQWNDLSKELLSYDDAVEKVDNYVVPDLEALKAEIASVDKDTDAEEFQRLTEEYVEAQKKEKEIQNCTEIIAIYDMLDETDYGDGTMLDFFTQDYDEVEDDVTMLYPLVASLTNGQRAGLEFVSLRELMLIAITTVEGYGSVNLDEIEEVSIYDGVDRGIYEKGGVALTSDAIRTKALNKVQEENSKLSGWSIATIALTGACFLALAGSAISWAVYASKFKAVAHEVNLTLVELEMAYPRINGKVVHWSLNEALKFSDKETQALYKCYAAKSAMCKYMTVGFGIAMIVFAGITTWLTWRDMCAYYDVKFSPIPHYMVDEKDIIGYNKKGEKIMLKNQSAYYKAVDCNRTESDEMFKALGTCADMNGDVGRQWLALYAVKNEVMEPILASSLKVVVDNAQIPAGYTTGIHMFGSDAAFNLNSSLYDWNDSAPSVYIYFKTDDSTASTTGANFTAGSLALAGGAGLVLGAAITAIASATIKKKEENKTAIA